MTTGEIIFLVLVILVALLAGAYFLGRRMQRKQAAAQVQLDSMKQTVSMLVIDKKMMKITQSGLPQQAIDSVPKYLRWRKMPIVKAKVGPRVVILATDKDTFNILPTKKEVNVELSGIYISALKSVRGGSVPTIRKKEGFFARLKKKAAKS